jgi:type II secretory pathway component PulM
MPQPAVMTANAAPKGQASPLTQKIVLWVVAIFALLALWGIFVHPENSGGCRPGGEITPAECGY